MDLIRKTFQIESFDGTMLHGKKDLVSSPRAAILTVHGVAEHLGRYDYLTDKFNGFGYSVYRYDQRGHGESDGERGFFSNHDTLADDVNAIVDVTKGENPAVPLFVVGHRGGHVVVRAFLSRSDSRSGLSYNTLVIPVFLTVVLVTTAQGFATWRNLANLSSQIAALVVVSLGQLMVALIGGLDLSVSSVISLVSCVIAQGLSRNQKARTEGTNMKLIATR
jgi:alpha-beta hydrolase superfamily lysophospholipase